MPFYRYKAVSGAGEVQEGVLEAASSTAAVARVQSMGLIPIRADEASPGGVAAPAVGERKPLFQRKTVTQNDIGIATRELATLLRAGLPLDRSFEILINLSGNPKLAELLANVRNEVRGGAALSKAQLEERLYGWGDEVESNAIEVHVHNLRKKLGAGAIRTIRGVGYVIARA